MNFKNQPGKTSVEELARNTMACLSRFTISLYWYNVIYMSKIFNIHDVPEIEVKPETNDRPK